MPTRRESPRAAEIDGVICVYGGGIRCGGNTGVLEMFDPATGHWTSGTPGMVRHRASVVALHGKLYAIGGNNNGVVDGSGNTAAATGTVTVGHNKKGS